jgi:hypothetical protein
LGTFGAPRRFSLLGSLETYCRRSNHIFVTFEDNPELSKFSQKLAQPALLKVAVTFLAHDSTKKLSVGFPRTMVSFWNHPILCSEYMAGN